MDDPVAMYLNDVFTVTVNLAGLPGLSVPAGLDANGLPLGLQVIGRAWDEATVFRVGKALEEAAGVRRAALRAAGGGLSVRRRRCTLEHDALAERRQRAAMSSAAAHSAAAG